MSMFLPVLMMATMVQADFPRPECESNGGYHIQDATQIDFCELPTHWGPYDPEPYGYACRCPGYISVTSVGIRFDANVSEEEKSTILARSGFFRPRYQPLGDDPEQRWVIGFLREGTTVNEVKGLVRKLDHNTEGITYAAHNLGDWPYVKIPRDDFSLTVHEEEDYEPVKAFLDTLDHAMEIRRESHLEHTGKYILWMDLKAGAPWNTFGAMHTVYTTIPEHLGVRGSPGYIAAFMVSDPGEEQDPSELLLGVKYDVDGSQSLDAADMQLVINRLLGIKTAYPYNCDVNDDGNENAVDVQTIINGLLGKE